MNLLFKRCLLQSLLFFFYVSINAQENIYFPKDIDSLNQYLDEITEKKINSISGNFKSKKKKIYLKNLKLIKEQIKDSSFVFIPEISSKLNSILNIIYNANPSINETNFYFLLSKSIYPNAAAYGDGSFVINLGLFNFLTSDDELAFILCHEIAHLLNNDVNKSIAKYVESVHSKSTKKQINKIRKQRYGKTNAGLSLLKELNFDMFSHSREVEMNADALGFELFSHTNYNQNAAKTTLEKLGKLEDLIFKNKINFEDLLNFKDFNFKKSWIQKEQGMFDITEKIDDYKLNKDSLRSHPHAKDRITHILSKNNIDTTSLNYVNKVILSLKPIAYKTQIETLFDEQQLDLLLYLTLSKIQLNKTNQQDYDNVAKCLVLIYKNKKNHTLGKKVSQVSPFSEEKNLNEIRRFIHKTELGELKKITYYFCLENKNHLSSKIYNDIINKNKL